MTRSDVEVAMRTEMRRGSAFARWDELVLRYEPSL